MKSQPGSYEEVLRSLLEALLKDPSYTERERAGQFVALEHLMQEGESRFLPPLPSTAPEFWKDAKRTDNPIDFADRVYGLWIECEMMSFADIRRLDPALYSALQNWKHHHGLPDWFNLLKKSELTARLAERMGGHRVREITVVEEFFRNRRKVGKKK